MSLSAWIIDIDVPTELDFSSCDRFLKDKTELSWIVNEIVTRQWIFAFHANNKLQILDSQWEEIYGVIEKSPSRLPQDKHEHQLSSIFLSKLRMMYGDSDITTLFWVLIWSWIASISEHQMNQRFLEIENKVSGINPLLVRERIFAVWGYVKYQWVLIDNIFDNRKFPLEAQIRTRERNLDNHTITETLTWKRKLLDTSPDFIYLLQAYLNSIEEDISLEDFSRDMKILLEEEMDIHDHEALDEILAIFFNIVRSKIKLRASHGVPIPSIDEHQKFEIEHFPLIPSPISPNWFMQQFWEKEAISPAAAIELWEVLGISHLKTTKVWARGEFKNQKAREHFLEFTWKPKHDERIYAIRDRIRRKAMRMMNNDRYFDTFRPI